MQPDQATQDGPVARQRFTTPSGRPNADLTSTFSRCAGTLPCASFPRFARRQLQRAIHRVALLEFYTSDGCSNCPRQTADSGNWRANSLPNTPLHYLCRWITGITTDGKTGSHKPSFPSAVESRAQATNQQPARARINVSMSTAGAFTTELEARFVVTEPGGTKRAPQGCEVLQVVAMSRCSRPKPNSEFLP